jgi:acyl-CoA synthetase (AMP-forming)/AMP-acid ligase II
MPKGIFQPARQVLYKARAHAERVDENSLYLCGYGIETTPGREIGTWFRGGTAIFPYGRRSQAAGQAGTITQATWIVTSPASLVAILASRGGEFEGREDRLVRVGGAPLPIGLRDEALKRFCARMDVIYGSMELGTMAEGDAALLDRHPGAVGYPPDEVEIEIVDADGEVAAPGVEGVLRVRAPHMAEGYIDNPEATAQFFRDGWFYPGDIALKEDDGLVVILGRESEVFNVGGVKFSANAIEQALGQIAGIKDICALAVPNRSGVNVLVILGVGEDAADLDALEAEIAGVLGTVGLLNFISRWRAEIPREGRSKLFRDRLAQDVRQELWG